VKIKTVFFCQDCGNESPKWTGQCSSCGAWNTMVEEKVTKQTKNIVPPYWHSAINVQKAKATPITEIVAAAEQRIVLKDQELNRVLGGGLVLGSVVLAAGEPGVGKSTLFLQAAIQFPQLKCLYVSGEESMQQIKMRADRIAIQHPNLYLLTTTNTKTIFDEIARVQPHWVIIDSIQTMVSSLLESAAGSVSQVKECTAEIQQFAKQSNIPVIIIGHITKDGTIAGPKVLEHAVDAVLQFEGDRHFAYRILRSVKNRFGSTAEIGIYEMSSTGMKEVSNPSDILLSQHTDAMSGIAIAGTVEGIRPIMIEVQALVANAVYGTPQRTNHGFDLRRLQLLLAVLEKRGGFHFGTKDVFLNIAGGLKIEDPAIDLAIICALLSSYQDVSLPVNICFVGEVGLSGEIRSVNRIEQRIAEADKLGMDVIVIPNGNLKGLDISKFGIKIKAVEKVSDVYQMLF
jgi:DNA repair protein RadA/Sms